MAMIDLEDDELFRDAEAALDRLEAEQLHSSASRHGDIPSSNDPRDLVPPTPEKTELQLYEEKLNFVRLASLSLSCLRLLIGRSVRCQQASFRQS